ncbi:AfsR/SARP family transcriptional regulator [Amycolatopsis sp. GM8]|uniref:AfsR/SARP family transcriptional regulator n=1 Tax=Amycolatopsis sp. GM8 TaxID=2896530 RepID=UPI001F195F33|nr:AfsR/SARP family transcriptional regulator [Amycolatopsis sp. GM8]
MRYQLLGPLQVVEGGEIRTVGAPKIETLFAVLLIRANQTVSSDELIGEIWGDNPPRRVRAGLHVYVSQLRKGFARPDAGGAVIETQANGYLLRVDESLVDLFELRALHARGRELLPSSPERALACFTAATKLFRGPVLARIRDRAIVSTFSRMVEAVRLECLESIARCSLQTGRHRELVSDLSGWIDEHPLHEAFREQLMLALHRSGRRADALAAYHSARKVLREELGLEPGLTMRRLQTAILDSEPDYSSPAPAPVG